MLSLGTLWPSIGNSASPPPSALQSIATGLQRSALLRRRRHLEEQLVAIDAALGGESAGRCSCIEPSMEGSSAVDAFARMTGLDAELCRLAATVMVFMLLWRHGRAVLRSAAVFAFVMLLQLWALARYSRRRWLSAKPIVRPPDAPPKARHVRSGLPPSAVLKPASAGEVEQNHSDAETLTFA